MTENEALEAVRAFIFDVCGKYKKSITTKTELENGLRMTGEDGVEFLDKFVERFHIDYSEFNMTDYYYFHGEGFMINLTWLWKEGRVKKKYKVITIKDLVNALITGKLK